MPGAQSSNPSDSQHLNSVGGDSAGMSSPSSIHLVKGTHERLEIRRGRWMNKKQNNAGLFQRRPALNCNPPEVLIQRKHDARFGFREVQQGRVLPSGQVSSCTQPPWITRNVDPLQMLVTVKSIEAELSSLHTPSVSGRTSTKIAVVMPAALKFMPAETTSIPAELKKINELLLHSLCTIHYVKKTKQNRLKSRS